MTWSSLRLLRIRSPNEAEPTLLAHKGHLVEGEMRRQRLTLDDVLSALRSEGLDDLSLASAVLLETVGSINVLTSLSERADGLIGVLSPVDNQPTPVSL